MRNDTIQKGSTVTLTYTPMVPPTRKGRREVEATIRRVEGNIVYLNNPFGHDDPIIVVDPENDVWARDLETGKDGFFGKNAEILT